MKLRYDCGRLRVAFEGCTMMMSRLLGLLLAGAMLASFGAASQPDVIVITDSGAVRGEVTQVAGAAVRAFRGIPFAAPPVGPLRWRPPQPPAPWKEVRDARQFSPACPQAPGLAYGQRFDQQSEDCLYLNVWTAAGASRERRPVMVWIHGGGNMIGGANSRVYDGQRLAAAGVVLASVQYRLGPLGYLAHPALTAEAKALDGREASGNYGLLDLVAALGWVRANIDRFGGDPDRVTIFGESAGAANVTHLMASPLAKGLFQRAIAQSGYFGENVPALTRTAGTARTAHDLGIDYAARIGVTGQGRDALAALRGLPVEKLLSVPMTIGGPGLAGGGAFKFGPVVDGHVLPRDPGDVWRAGDQHRVPLIAGSNLDDGSVFTGGTPVQRLTGYRLTLQTIFGADGQRALEVFPAASDEDVLSAVRRVTTITAFRAPARRLVRWAEAAGGKAWLYHFSRNPGVGMAARERGVVHGLEIPYVFGVLTEFMGDIDRAVSADMMQRWVSFAFDGDPNGPSRGATPDAAPAWPAYRAADDRHLEFGDRTAIGQHLDRDACDLADRTAARRRRALS